MSTEKLFETAIRNKFRFNFKGQVSTEDLFDLSVRDLDTIFKTLNSQMKQATEESLLETKSKEDKVIELKIEIVKYIVSVKIAEENARLKAKENREQKQKIMSILAVKQEESLHSKSEAELLDMLGKFE